MKSLPLYLLLLLLCCLSCTNQAEQTTTEKEIPEYQATNTTEPPNIILIISDDLGYGSLGVSSAQKFKTPQLDFWANNGLQFTNFYVASPVCSPSRANILTGQSPQQAGVTQVLRPAIGAKQKGMDYSLPTFVELLQKEGYETGLVGKWHLGYRTEEHPLARGFDSFSGFLGGAIHYLTHEYTIGGHALSQGRAVWHPPQGQHATSIFTEEAIKFVAKQRTSPYFLMLSYANPHRPFILPKDDLDQPVKRPNTAKRYQRMVALLDQQIGRLHHTLSQLKQNTVVIFLSDHGANATLQGNGPLKGGKGDLYEGGIKVPAFIYWPGKVSEEVVTQPVSTYDLYPTILALAQINKPDTIHLSGKPLVDKQGASLPSHPTIRKWKHYGVKVIREGDWKAFFIPAQSSRLVDRYLDEATQTALRVLADQFNGHIPLLYNLAEDPNEANNYAVQNQQKLTHLWNLFNDSSEETSNSQY